jgi:queuosine precursor transporter
VVVSERRPQIGAVAMVLYVATVVAANWFVQHVGTQSFPGGPHTIPVGFGYRAPSGVLWIGVAFTLRDVVQSLLGKRAVIVGILVGAALSYVVAPALAFASAAAFLVSETLDFLVYTPLVDRDRVVTAVTLSNTVGLVVDTVVFLQIAFGSLDFWQGQIIGKAEMTVLAVLLIVPARRALARD